MPASIGKRKQDLGDQVAVPDKIEEDSGDDEVSQPTHLIYPQLTRTGF